jgi:ABC-type phosphate/phosphonate transport system substrate-binding protein
MSGLIANARMYGVTPEAEAAWRGLIERIAAAAGVSLAYEAYPAPRPLEVLWARPDLGAVQMCGYPIALGLADVVPIAAPVPALDWAAGRPVYRSDLIVRADAPYRRLEDTFGGRAGWTVEHSHSGFNAFRHHLLGYRTAERPKLYGAMVGPLVTARRVLDGVLDGSIDVGPLDGYWHALIRRHRPDLTAGIRVIASTEAAPIPAFVATATADPGVVRRLKASFAAAADEAWFGDFAEPLLLARFVPVDRADYATTLAWDRDAVAAGYAMPA